MRKQYKENYRLTLWIAGFELLLTFALADAAVVAWSASLMTASHLFAWALAYALVAFGSLFTVFEMSRPGQTRRLPVAVRSAECPRHLEPARQRGWSQQSG